MSRQELHPLTAVINKAQKNKSKHAKRQALLWLSSTFPQVFNTSLSIQPLKIGILNDILAHQPVDLGISKSKIREALREFTRRVEYLTCLKAREMRVDLQGNPVEMVSEEEAKQAAMKIKKRIEKSAKNARKVVTSKVTAPSPSRSSNTKASPGVFSYPNTHHATPHYGDRAAPTSPKISPVITHKSNRTYDPIAVARLKERLGIARKEKVEEEA